jgi:hypothetical protein
MNQEQFIKARLYQVFKIKMLSSSDKNKPPTPSECLLYEMTFAFRDEVEQSMSGHKDPSF